MSQTTITLKSRERDTILAALRYYQNDLDAHKLSDDVDPEGEINAIASNGGQSRGLDAKEIDGLCYHLNR